MDVSFSQLVTLEQGFPIGVGSIQQCLRTFLLVTKGRSTTDIWWVQTRDVGKYPKTHRTAPTTITQLKILMTRLKNSVLKLYFSKCCPQMTNIHQYQVNVVEMQIYSPHPRPNKLKTLEMGSSNLWFNKPQIFNKPQVILTHTKA